MLAGASPSQSTRPGGPLPPVTASPHVGCVTKCQRVKGKVPNWHERRDNMARLRRPPAWLAMSQPFGLAERHPSPGTERRAVRPTETRLGL
jgi:hypothetical protein